MMMSSIRLDFEALFPSGTTPTATGLSAPACVSVDLVGNVYACDGGNNRVAMFAPGSSTASAVWGWPSLTTPGFAVVTPPTASSLNAPSAVGFYDGGTFVADTGSCSMLAREWHRDSTTRTNAGNNRVLFFASGQFVASHVWGQAGVFVTAGG